MTVINTTDTSISQTVITGYKLKENALKMLKQPLMDYVNQALKATGNIMAEAYLQDKNEELLWVIERWDSNAFWTEYQLGSENLAFNELLAQVQNGPMQRYFADDTEPLKKEVWKQVNASGPNEFTIMLILQAQSGKEEEFKNLYHQAMPAFRDEKGVITYQLSQDSNDKTQFLTYEKFRDQNAFQYHLGFEPINPILNFLRNSIQQPPFENGLHKLIQIAPENIVEMKDAK